MPAKTKTNAQVSQNHTHNAQANQACPHTDDSRNTPDLNLEDPNSDMDISPINVSQPKCAKKQD